MTLDDAITREGFVAWFWSHVDRSGECWTWTHTTDSYGYGKVYLYDGHGHRSEFSAHRLSCVMDGRNPGGRTVRHACDNPPCVRPSHLLLGTQADNCRDMWARDRGYRGLPPPSFYTHHRIRLTESIVRDIRARAAAGESQRKIARELGVSHATVNDAVVRRTWGHIP